MQLDQCLLANEELKVMKLPDPLGLAPSSSSGRDRPVVQLCICFYTWCWVQSRAFKALLPPIRLFMLSVLNGVLM